MGRVGPKRARGRQRRPAEGTARRVFWERFVDRAFAGAPSATARRDLLGEAARIVSGIDLLGGQVTFVGAGPGDAELLTVKAIRVLQAADIILFDDLISHNVLELGQREAGRIQVGTHGGRTDCRQEDVDELMVKLARAGKRVVWLKSGDPMILGDSREEIARLEGSGIAVCVVPGVASVPEVSRNRSTLASPATIGGP
ncbi:uroporphyrinogen-III C-methyltransferase [Mesorhizobium kowhaii]|uniref:uroporphyrinogen-III C-methyltransferase n=1 Tax=Mesorhizobium kowhaii TaxID=1300272 RepID=UPI0035EB34BF